MRDLPPDLPHDFNNLEFYDDEWQTDDYRAVAVTIGVVLAGIILGVFAFVAIVLKWALT
tara:strand:+ start:41794 stop:41970 length:177 start_codon:yes stop_codon:yes gene_type:complete